MTALLSLRLRWLEPAGQLVVLVALGFQFFQVNPAVEASNQATSAYVQALLEQHTLPEHPERARRPIDVDRAKVELGEAQISAKENKEKAVLEKTRSSRIYIWLFILGTMMVIIGKVASVAYATKAPSADTRRF